ncbi:LLM class flavin-dependent oxidoreductase [Saccharopolyspora sp. 5N102]|uniref:LLM class flavin-dependent oxidoreductase n=1 Tax=Saccharopolyspora sp. 5N102 TaxID=3375155 RepID=UPI0037A404C1
MSISRARKPFLHLGYALPVSESPSADPLQYDPDRIVAVARAAEAAKFDFLLFDDALTAAADENGFEPFTLASFVAVNSSKIGLVVAATAAYNEPFNLARLTASLDHISGGRAAWNVLPDRHERFDASFSRDAGDSLQRVDEFVSVVRGLWDTWEDDAFLRDQASGVFVDGAKIHRLDHDGVFFRVRGPLNVARPPQGQLVIAHRADASANWGAEVVFTEARGRDELLTFANLTPIVDTARVLDGEVVRGDPVQLADHIQERFTSGEVDGFTIRSGFEQLTEFTRLVVPELQARGIFRTEYAGTTLRDHLGLARPAGRFSSDAEKQLT